ncbi:MAG TPA: sugar phosphate nucleotidyltransferase [Saprospiraceae bacterium]|jgi:NDP-sugar pyrophosphorylase family protein|nr:nucleotidyltransferase [Saprospiraceae bacterium]HUN16499.1 sugar phosphate nucleotidyltransferase [Saprospiraceae bacterium]
MSLNKPSLLILAAGMGSRYGGLKQMDGFGPSGETIIDYSIYDAILAGFEKIVFIIRKSFEKEFKERMNQKWANKVKMEFVFQELDDLPDNFECPADREKPWGTGHALWAARSVIKEGFGVINADDYYGREALKVLYDYLSAHTNSGDYAVVAYLLENTLSDHGEVNRGICKANEDGYLELVEECKGISRNADGLITCKKAGELISFDKHSLVSMNMWAFQSSYFQYAESYFISFLESRLNEFGSEFYIPELIQDLIERQIIKVEILTSPSHWFGVTYIEDKPFVAAQLQKMIDDGFYPTNLS